MSAFHFLRPYWLLALLPAGLLLWALWRSRTRGSAWSAVIEPGLLARLWLEPPGQGSRRALWLLGAAWLLATLALAGPTWQRMPLPAWRSLAARVVVLDLSPSMNTADPPPSRLARARFKVRDLLAHSRGGRLGLVAFAGEAHLVTPLTDDAATLTNLLGALSPDIAPVPGGNAAPALAMAARLLRQGGARPGEVVLLSDGVDDMSRALAEARALRRQGYRLAVIGVGGPGLDAGPLQALARAGGGAYARISADDRDLDQVLRPFGRAVALTPGQRQRIERWVESGLWLLPPLLLIALAGFRRGWLMGLAALALVPPPAQAFGWQDLWWRPDQQASRLLPQDPERAAKRFTDPAWRGMARYRAGDYLGAARDFAQAGGVENRYNQGNALARAGRLEAAAQAYRDVLKLRPGHRDARRNLDLVRRLLDQRQAEPRAGQGPSQRRRKPAPGQSGQRRQPTGGQSGHEKAGGRQSSASGKAQKGAPRGRKAQTGKGGAPKQPSGAKSGAVDRKSGKGAGQAPAQPRNGRRPDSAQAAREDVRGAARPGKTGKARERMAGGASRAQAGRGDVELRQWLRQIPDDPAGLLRRKFMLDHLRHEQEGR